MAQTKEKLHKEMEDYKWEEKKVKSEVRDWTNREENVERKTEKRPREGQRIFLCITKPVAGIPSIFHIESSDSSITPNSSKMFNAE